MARIAALAEAVGLVTSPGRKAAMWRTRAMLPLTLSRPSRSCAGALRINAFRMIAACDLLLMALSQATFRSRIISTDPICDLAIAVA